MSHRYIILEEFFKRISSLSGWKKTSQNPFNTISPQQCPSFFVFDFHENVLQQSKIPERIKCELMILVKFWVTHTPSDIASKILNSKLQEIQALFQNNRSINDGYNLGGKVQLVTEVSSQFKIESISQRVSLCEILYRADYIRDQQYD